MLTNVTQHNNSRLEPMYPPTQSDIIRPNVSRVKLIAPEGRKKFHEGVGTTSTRLVPTSGGA